MLTTVVGSANIIVPLPTQTIAASPAIPPPADPPSSAPGQLAWSPGGTAAPANSGGSTASANSGGSTASATSGGPTDPDVVPSSPPSSAGPTSDPAPHDRFKNHVVLAEADIEVYGVSTPEFALADAGANKVLVKVGIGGQFTALGTAQGIDAPESVALADLNNDGIPDLVVANSGANNVLVFPGLAGGGFGPEVNDGKGFAVGTNPVGVTIGYLNQGGLPNLIVANKGSDTVSILEGQTTPAGWTLTLSTTIDVALPSSGIVMGESAQALALATPAATTQATPALALATPAASSPAATTQATPTPAASPAPASPAPAASTPGLSTAASPAPAAPQLTAPVKTVLYDLNHDGLVDLFVCNSGSNTVYMYQGLGNGQFDLANPTIFNVGLDPIEMFVGRFDKRPQVDLVTVNSGSDDLTFISGIFLPHPSTMSFSSGGVTPDAAFAVDLNHSGLMDLVVANSGDGSLALLQPASEGMLLAGVITQADIPVPTGLAPASWNSGGIDFFAAGAGLDAAQLLHFDLGTASSFLAVPLDEAGSFQGSEEELFAQLVAFDDSSLELMPVYWTGSPDCAGDQRRIGSPGDLDGHGTLLADRRSGERRIDADLRDHGRGTALAGHPARSLRDGFLGTRPVRPGDRRGPRPDSGPGRGRRTP